MASIGPFSYGTASVLFIVLSIILVSAKRGRPQKKWLALASLVTAVWAAVAAYTAGAGGIPVLATLVEVPRDVAWSAFLVMILRSATSASHVIRTYGRILALSVAMGIGLLALLVFSVFMGGVLVIAPGINVAIAFYLAFSIGILVLVEHLYRNTPAELRRSVKYLCLGIGGMFVYDFYMYADALLLQRVDIRLWQARGFINAMVVPVIAFAIVRDPRWSMELQISRRVMFHSTALFGASLYLLAMGVGGYYVRIYGGDWGVVAQTIFLFGAAMLLSVLLFSGQIRASLRVLINKHFFHYKYEYREEWLRFIRTLSSDEPDTHLRVNAVKAIGQIVESPGGALWLRRESAALELIARWNLSEEIPPQISGDDPLVRFLEAREWVINLDEYRDNPAHYGNAKFEKWLLDCEGAWLVVPLILHERLFGFVVLLRSHAAPVRTSFDWEDCDLLKTAGRQAASHLAQLEASLALAEARQFEAFNRLSTYVVHDLKNLVAQLSLVVSNAAKHRGNPAFMEDAINTVRNSVDKMTHLLADLRSGRARTRNISSVQIAQVLDEVVRARSGTQPAPQLRCNGRDVLVKADRERFATILSNLIQNAQDATPENGEVTVTLSNTAGDAVIEISDTGCGMDEEFVREHLFKPFDSTKGSSGMGIGAFEAREFVRAMGGEMSVGSRPGAGTTITIRLPAISEAAATMAGA